MTELIPFTYGNQPVRVVSIDGAPWFVLADLCRTLGLTRSAGQVAQRLDEGVRQTYTLETAGGRQAMTIVSEPGMYEVVIRSDKPEAVTFRRWITTEVLPSIRKRGGYLTPEAAEKALTDPDFIIRLATDLKSERAARVEAEARAQELEVPAKAWGHMASSTGDYAVADAAKVLSRDPAINIGRTRLFKWMQIEGWAYRDQRGDLKAYQTQIDNGRLTEKLNRPYLNERTGETEVPAPTIRVTPKGLAEMHKRLGGTEALAAVAEVAA